MNTKHTPATPLPWHGVDQGTAHLFSQACDGEFRFAIGKVFEQQYHPDGLAANQNEAKQNLAYITHTANAYPGLIAERDTLRAIVARIAPGDPLWPEARAALNQNKE